MDPNYGIDYEAVNEELRKIHTYTAKTEKLMKTNPELYEQYSIELFEACLNVQEKYLKDIEVTDEEIQAAGNWNFNGLQ